MACPRLAAGRTASSAGAAPFARRCEAKRRPRNDSTGVSAMVIDVTASAAAASRESMRLSAAAVPMPTKANSPPGPSSKPISTATGQDSRNNLPRPITNSALTATRPTTATRTKIGSASNSRTSISIPTVKKKMPSSSPLNGPTAASMARRYSVSASKSPATKAPSAIERPAVSAVTPAAMITNSTAAMKSSRERVVHQAKERPHQHPAEQHDGGKRDHSAQERSLKRRNDRSRRPGREQRDEDQEGNDGEVLGQQHGKAGAAKRGRQTLLVRQKLEHDRGRRQGKAGAQDDRFRRVAAEIGG